MIETNCAVHATFLEFKDHESIDLVFQKYHYKLILPLGTGKKFADYLNELKRIANDIWAPLEPRTPVLSLKLTIPVVHVTDGRVLTHKEIREVKFTMTSAISYHEILDIVLGIEFMKGISRKNWRFLYPESFKMTGFINDFDYLFTHASCDEKYIWSTDYTLEYKTKGDNYRG